MEMMQISAASRAAFRSDVNEMEAGRLRYSFFRVSKSSCKCCEPGRPHKVTSWPMWSAYQAWKLPQRPQPKTVIFMEYLL